MALTPSSVSALVERAKESVDSAVLVEAEAHIDHKLMEYAKTGVSVASIIIDLDNRFKKDVINSATMTALLTRYENAGGDVVTHERLIRLTMKKVIHPSFKIKVEPSVKDTTELESCEETCAPPPLTW